MKATGGVRRKSTGNGSLTLSLERQQAKWREGREAEDSRRLSWVDDYNHRTLRDYRKLDREGKS
jgi:hypothetical protein